MQRWSCLAVLTTISAALLAPQATVPVRAQTAPATVAPNAEAGRIARFLSPTKLGNSALFQSGSMIGLGTTNPTSKLDIRAQDALNIRGSEPFMTLRDTNAGNARHVIQSVDGGLNLLGEKYLNGSNPSAFVRIDKEGKVGIGAPNPEGTFQIGPSPDAMFRIEPSPGSPWAGVIRFGDNTGWRLLIGRSRNSSGAALNTGNTGTFFVFSDNGAFGASTWPLGFTGTFPLCIGAESTFITHCQSSSLRYKTAIEPYRGGLDVVSRLQPIAFTRKHSGAREVGLGAEDVEQVEPLLTFRNGKDEIEGVKYELLGAVLVNAVKEQQEQLQRQQKLIEELQSAVARLEDRRAH